MKTARTLWMTLAATAAAAGTALVTGAGPAAAADGPSLRIDRTTVSPGDTVHVSAYCGRHEGLNHVGSAAFAATGHDGPYEGNGGVVVFTEVTPTGGEGHATIRADAAPGTYHVGQRCGGGNAGGLDLTIT